MTQVVTVHTDFTDLNQMAQGLVGRVNDTHVILPGPDPVEVGEWVQFAVTLYDGTPGFAGVGRCVTVVDNGEDRLSHQRYDVVIDSLQFDPRGQQIFDHILALSTGGEGEAGYAEAGYAEAAEYAGAEAAAYAGAEEADEGGVLDVSAEFASVPAPEPASQGGDEEATVIGARADLEAALSLSAQDDVIATVPPDGIEAEAEAPAAPAVNGYHAPATPYVNGHSFKYTDGLPFPPVPPRPELDATRRVTPAPRPPKQM